ncbi:DUF559 domain-containing protein [Bacillus sp. V3B]|uniref:zinc-ribbon domain-containing protein n=1 Tax=Bacillus sp. V3B TaxID=2804915 RepID=UPI00210E19C2|nr:zinc-ribbon domain-containing protein [Bacillus sp. V3B]MCQ6274701.1 DUF559 domain-containing protein [Bacillus sp. V3B]
MKNTRGFIAEERPELIEEWPLEKNNGNTPYNVRTGSDKYIIWHCKECGHNWETQAKNRAIHNTGCPKCHERYNVGFPELAIYFYFKKIFKDAQLNTPIKEIEKYKTVDLYIPSLKLVIEYDGAFAHKKNVNRDIEKSRLILKAGYSLIRVRDNGLPPLKINGMQEYLYERSTFKKISEMIKDLLSMIDDHYNGYTEDIKRVKNTIQVDIDNIPILAQIPGIIVKDNLLESVPEIQKIWDYERNLDLLPQHFKRNSNFMAFFKCKEGHTSLAQIGSKAKGHGCKVCAGQEATEEHNLKLLFPEISKEWNYEKNDKPPEEYRPHSNEKVYWDCPKCKSTYDYIINWRTSKGENCPYCAGKRVNETNCLATTHPHLLKEWDHEKNKELGLTPFNVTKGQHDKVWWICERGHSHDALIYSRTAGRKCRYCYEEYGRFKPRKVKKEKSLAVKKTEIAKQWHPTENGDVRPDEVGPYAREEYIWHCENGHKWSQAPNSRRSAKCRYCKKNSL